MKRFTTGKLNTNHWFLTWPQNDALRTLGNYPLQCGRVATCKMKEMREQLCEM